MRSLRILPVILAGIAIGCLCLLVIPQSQTLLNNNACSATAVLAANGGFVTAADYCMVANTTEAASSSLQGIEDGMTSSIANRPLTKIARKTATMTGGARAVMVLPC